MNLHFARLIRLIIVYFDNCCYSRLFDVNAQAKVKMETAKIRDIIRNRFAGKYILALAEEAKADYLLTTDLDFITKSARPNFTKVKVINPLDF